MYFRPVILSLLAAFAVAGLGCKKSESRVLAPTNLPPDTIASVHWLGKHQLGYEATAFYLMRIWNQTASVRLERQALNHLASTSERFFPGTDGSGALMLPLVSDLEQAESYFEIKASTNFQPAAVLAVHLPDPAKTGRWFTNLAAILQPLTVARLNSSPLNESWSLNISNTVIRLTHVSNWTLVSAGPDENPLLAEITARITRDGAPFVSGGTNLWFEASLRPQRLASFFFHSASVASPARTEGRGGAGFFSNLDHLNLTITGDGGNVITRAKLNFTRPFISPLPPWRLPLGLMHDPMTSFTAVRGFESSLSDWQPWRDLEMGGAPDQICLWSVAGSPYQLYLAAPLTNAAAQVACLTDHLLQKGNPWLAANGYISFDRSPDGNGVVWGDLPDIKPFIKSAGTASDGWLFAGLLPETNSAVLPPPAGLINDVLRRTNLMYYDWEVTGPQLQPVLSLARTARLLTRQPQLDADSASLNWLGTMIPRLGTAATIANLTGPAELTVIRRSTIGFTSPELQFLSSWLESTNFPFIGL